MSRLADQLVEIILEAENAEGEGPEPQFADPDEYEDPRKCVEALNINDVLNERGSRYGIFSEHALITQNIKAAMHRSPNWQKLPADMKESLEMTAHKIGRILNGDPFYDDSWVDIIGYTQLVVDRLRGQSR